MVGDAVKPKVLVLASRKGGVGKSTICLNLALLAEGDGYGPVVLYDTDPQASVKHWYEQREAEMPGLIDGGPNQLDDAIMRAAKGGVRLLIVDTPPNVSTATDSVIRRADFVVIPTQDGWPDLQAAAATVDMVEQMDKPFAFALTFIRGSIQAAEAATALSARGPIGAMISNRLSVKAAWNTARAVVETDPRGKAAEEYKALWRFIAPKLGFTPQKPAKKKERMYV